MTSIPFPQRHGSFSGAHNFQVATHHTRPSIPMNWHPRLLSPAPTIPWHSGGTSNPKTRHVGLFCIFAAEWAVFEHIVIQDSRTHLRSLVLRSMLNALLQNHFLPTSPPSPLGPISPALFHPVPIFPVIDTFSTGKRLIMRYMEKGRFWGTSLGSMMRG